MENKNLTAVEWLIEQLVELDKELDGRRKSDDSTVIKINPTKIYKQAKQMEKEQIVKAWDGGNYQYFCSVRTNEDFDNGYEYYEEQYKSE